MRNKPSQFPSNFTLPSQKRPPIGLGQEQGFEDAAVWDSNDDALAPLMVQELKDIILKMSMRDSMAALLESGSRISAGSSKQTWRAL
jgi:hypothetical protein